MSLKKKKPQATPKKTRDRRAERLRRNLENMRELYERDLKSARAEITARDLIEYLRVSRPMDQAKPWRLIVPDMELALAHMKERADK